MDVVLSIVRSMIKVKCVGRFPGYCTKKVLESTLKTSSAAIFFYWFGLCPDRKKEE